MRRILLASSLALFLGCGGGSEDDTSTDGTTAGPGAGGSGGGNAAGGSPGIGGAAGASGGSAHAGSGQAGSGQAGQSGHATGGQAGQGQSGSGGAQAGGAAGAGGAHVRGGSSGAAGTPSGGTGGKAGSSSAGAPGADDPPFAKKRGSCDFVAGDKTDKTFGPSIAKLDIPIDTFVIIMQENHSFDHYFGALKKTQPDADVAALDASIPGADGKPAKRHHETDLCTEDTGHGWNTMHSDWNNGKMDGFAKQNGTTANPSGNRTMGYYDETDIPFYYGLANTFSTNDRYFAPTMTQTGPNRLYMYAATSGGFIDNSGSPKGIETIFDRMTTSGVSWKVYRPGSYSFESGVFPYLLTKYPKNFDSIATYNKDCAAGTLPNVVFVYPGSDEHPANDVQLGETDVYEVFLKLAASPAWQKSAFFWTYDEDGGFYDHVAPPKACAPDDIPPKLVAGSAKGDFAQYGFRVPIVVASAWSKPHHVSHEVSDHTSILRLLELRFGMGALTARDANASALIDMFDFSTPSFPTAPTLPAAVFDMAHYTSSKCQLSSWRFRNRVGRRP